MSTMILAQEFLSAVGVSAFEPGGAVVASSTTAPTGQTISTSIRTFIGPLVMLAVGLAALVFLFKREMTKFFQFAALAVGVAVFFFTPNFLEVFGGWVGSIFGGTGTDPINTP